MVDLSAINDILSIRNGVWGIFALLVAGLWRFWTSLPAVMQQWIAGRQQRAAEEAATRKAAAEEKAADWERLRDELNRLAERVKALEAESAHWRERAITAEALVAMKQAIIDGQGEVRQAAASAAAEIRIDDADKKRRQP